ncbi:uncharacterized protein VP01_83g12 [Puccinia sorghi]|uniref:DDE Tnp4 domain-containing protein n=1 Tax=Puccinia sorghi TaxID=27349 RepID=A0A0L6U9G1_9BASI|nr:uncharacterized protein VP01_83g12 [Puccinia sorghi]
MHTLPPFLRWLWSFQLAHSLRGRIITTAKVTMGLLGCSHDQCLMSNSILASNPQDFFSGGKYVLANSAFTPTTNLVPAFKQNKNHILSNEEHNLNRHHSGMRDCLKGLRLRVSSKQGSVNEWIITCDILHNFLNQGGSDYDFMDFENEETLQDDSTPNPNGLAIPMGAGGKKKRDIVVAQAKEFRDNGGEY